MYLSAICFGSLPICFWEYIELCVSFTPPNRICVSPHIAVLFLLPSSTININSLVPAIPFFHLVDSLSSKATTSSSVPAAGSRFHCCCPPCREIGVLRNGRLRYV
ncbi:hypothetical protein COP2_008609 [Malus domestica]